MQNQTQHIMYRYKVIMLQIQQKPFQMEEKKNKKNMAQSIILTNCNVHIDNK